jgi:activator of HSP90 ATPase
MASPDLWDAKSMQHAALCRRVKYDLEHNLAACCNVERIYTEGAGMKDESNHFALQHLSARRQLVLGMATACASLAAGSRAWGQQPASAKDNSCSTGPARTTLHYQVEYKVSPQRIYEALLDSKQFAAFTGLRAEIDASAGGACSMFGGMIVGRNIELIPNQRIVQAWRPGHWSPGVFSVVRFELAPRGSEATLVLDHTGFPEGNADGLDQGWHAHYIDGLRKYFG